MLNLNYKEVEKQIQLTYFSFTTITISQNPKTQQRKSISFVITPIRLTESNLADRLCQQNIWFHSIQFYLNLKYYTTLKQVPIIIINNNLIQRTKLHDLCYQFNQIDMQNDVDYVLNITCKITQTKEKKNSPPKKSKISLKRNQKHFASPHKKLTSDLVKGLFGLEIIVSYLLLLTNQKRQRRLRPYYFIQNISIVKLSFQENCYLPQVKQRKLQKIVIYVTI
eukprot:TRINITY_DN5736_c0_g2_i2.p1 TRINITY_DN5736_c0_g2~~TRINITY_DN5736_c0_g2_i2.p1  ORF type:complete len:223 (+),score=-9.34 TRINITY_DN5736_c0_g2_i2:677-1345(+)